MQAFFDSCVWILGNHPKNHTPASDSNLPPPSIMQDAFSQTTALKRRILAITGLAFLVLAGWLWLGEYQHDKSSGEKALDEAGVSTSEPDPLVPKAQPAGTRLTMGIREGIEKARLEAETKQQAQRAIDEADEAEAKRLAHWRAHFPYPKQTNSILAYNPSRYDVLNPETFNDDPVMENAVDDHAFMTCFYKNPQIEWPEFEQLYHLLEAVDRGDNPRITAEIFSCLQLYHKTVYYGRDAFGPKTPKEAYESYADPIVGMLVLDRYWPDRPLMSLEDARQYRDRLLKEIPPDRLILKRQPNEVFAFGDLTMANLKAGDPLLTSNPNILYYGPRFMPPNPEEPPPKQQDHFMDFIRSQVPNPSE